MLSDWCGVDAARMYRCPAMHNWACVRGVDDLSTANNPIINHCSLAVTSLRVGPLIMQTFSYAKATNALLSLLKHK